MNGALLELDIVARRSGPGSSMCKRRVRKSPWIGTFTVVRRAWEHFSETPGKLGGTRIPVHMELPQDRDPSLMTFVLQQATLAVRYSKLEVKGPASCISRSSQDYSSWR